MRAHLQSGRPLPALLAAFIARELLTGLAHAHNLRDHHNKPLGIVHRDISPQNVLLSTTGEVKLTDFGIAAARHKLTLTSPGTVLGKAAYMSPEQATGKPVDFATDVWAVGVILHEMLSGERLFADETPLQTVQRVVHEPIPPPSSKQKTLPAALDWIVMRALDRKPQNRYPSAQAMADELSAFLLAEPVDGRAYEGADLARYIAELEWADDTSRMRPSHKGVGGGGKGSGESTGPQLPQIVQDRGLEKLLASLKEAPDLWTLVAIADRYGELGHTAPAVSAYRTAAAVFAHRGLLVQSLCAYDGAKAWLTPPEEQADLLALGDLSPGNRAELSELLAKFDHHGFWALLQESDPHGLGSNAEALPFPSAPTPLLGALGPTELSRIGQVARVVRLHPGEVAIREGDDGHALYAVGRGRLVVYCKPGSTEDAGFTAAEDAFADSTSVEAARQKLLSNLSGEQERVYLAGLADGDFFGEFSFLTERPRSATVEAINECLLLEIDRKSVKAILDADPAFTEPILQFYKERVLELMMAKSPVFSLLEPHDRRALLRKSSIEEFKDSDLVVEEGTTNDALYFIKSGEVEVFRTDKDGIPIFINKLWQGQFFGEIAALKGTPRSVSVRAMGPVSLFRIEKKALLEIVDRQPRLRELFDATIAMRTAETVSRVQEHQRVFFGT
jgi:CRP-like cAMP-binding protein